MWTKLQFFVIYQRMTFIILTMPMLLVYFLLRFTFKWNRNTEVCICFCYFSHSIIHSFFLHSFCSGFSSRMPIFDDCKTKGRKIDFFFTNYVWRKLTGTEMWWNWWIYNRIKMTLSIYTISFVFEIQILKHIKMHWNVKFPIYFMELIHSRLIHALYLTFI